MKWLLAGLLVAHGFVHITVWASAKAATEQGTTPDHSWVLGDQHSIVIGLTYLVVALFAAAAGALLLEAEWWRQAAVMAAATSLLLVALFPGALLGPWIVAPVAIDVALIVAIIWLQWPRSLMGT